MIKYQISNFKVQIIIMDNNEHSKLCKIKFFFTIPT